MNHNLKLVIIGSLTILVLASAGIGIYVWKLGKSTTTNTTSGTSQESTTPAQAKTESVKSVTVTPNMLDENGKVDLKKVLESN